MNTFDDIQAIQAHFASVMPGDLVTVYDNDDPVSEPQEVWARLTIRPGDESARSFPPRRYVQQGRVWLTVVSPPGIGTEEARAVSDAFIAAFRDKYVDGYRIRFFQSSESPAVRQDDQDYVITINVRYEAEH